MIVSSNLAQVIRFLNEELIIFDGYADFTFLDIFVCDGFYFSHSALSEKHRCTAIEILLTLFHATLPHLRPSSQKVRYRKLNNIKKLKKSYQDDKNDKQVRQILLHILMYY